VKLHRRHRDPKVAWLLEHPWWGQLSTHDLIRMACLGHRRDVPEAHVLMLAGERGIDVALIIEGEVVVQRGGRILAWLGAGDIVGELALLDGMPRNADVRTASKVQLLVFDEHELRAVLEAIAPLRERVLELAARHRGTPIAEVVGSES
jgi:CRP/FNR family transcriptional regulator, cyclic AMP receptor protein